MVTARLETGLDMAAMMMRHISDYRREEASNQRVLAKRVERAMRLRPGTPERNTADGLVAQARERQGKAKAQYMAIARLARATEALSETQIAEAIAQGKTDLQ